MSGPAAPAHGKLLLIDSATSGCAGAYIDSIHRVIHGSVPTEVGVSYYYGLPYGQRIFFKYSELTAQSKYRLGRFRLYVRFAELVVALARLYAYVVRHRVRVVCYALSSNLWAEYAFLWLCKHVARAQVYLICHDVIPFVLPGEDGRHKLEARRKFYELPDRLIAHNDNSIRELMEVFAIPRDKILSFPFPLPHFAPLGLRDVPVPRRGNRQFLFLGHLRPEKGIDVLLSAWTRFHEQEPSAELIIAGNVPVGTHYDFTALNERNIRLKAGYIADDEYVSLVRHCDCVILPYRRGTNSGIASTVVSIGKPMIASDIPMFTNNELIPRDAFFRNGDVDSLVERLLHFQRLDDAALIRMQEGILRACEVYERRFAREALAVFDEATSR